MVEEEAKLRKELQSLKSEHKSLDEEIESLESEAVFDQLKVKRLKKRKLFLKDRISLVEAMIYDDIIA